MRYLILLLVLLLLGACGKPERTYSDERSASVDPDIAPFVETFYEATRMSRVDIPVNFGPLPPQKVGMCFFGPEGGAEIRISVEFWLYYPHLREFLVWHEMGHCVLGMAHSPDSTALMWAYADWNPSRRNEYIHEIWTEGNRWGSY